jgi:hypothetical protein
MLEITVLGKASLYLLAVQHDCQPETKGLVEVITSCSLRSFLRGCIQESANSNLDTTSTHSGDTPPAYVNPPEYFDPPAANSNPPKYSTLAEPECLSIAPPPSAAAQSNFNTQVLPLPVPIIIPDLVVVPIAQIMVRDEGEAEQGIAPRSSPIRYRPRLRLRKFSSVCCFWTILIILLALVFGIGMVTVACAAGHFKTAEQVQMHYE